MCIPWVSRPFRKDVSVGDPHLSGLLFIFWAWISGCQPEIGHYIDNSTYVSELLFSPYTLCGMHSECVCAHVCVHVYVWACVVCVVCVHVCIVCAYVMCVCILCMHMCECETIWEWVYSSSLPCNSWDGTQALRLWGKSLYSLRHFVRSIIWILKASLSPLYKDWF